MPGESCFAGVAAGLGLGLTKEVFEYNRQNFHHDRDFRREKEFTLMEFRIKQAEQWREDVKDMVSLTEKKMHIYLLSLVLLCLITMILWTEGRLDESYAPEWLMTGYCLAMAGAFMFLLLSIWLGIYSAVSAQSFEVRLRTQFVRLPIPSWNEMEACRTYGSQFEKTEAKQMFRIPFLMGRQEDLVRTAPEQTTPATVSQEDPEIAGEPQVLGPAADVPVIKEEIPFADPWGLERPNDALELGTALREQVADQWHIKLSRQTAAHWQTYDSYARVSFTIGVNQTLLALTYFNLGYLLGSDKCREAAGWGFWLFMCMMEGIFVLDMDVPTLQLRFMQVLIASGPLISLCAMKGWNHGSDVQRVTAEFLVPLAFILHALYLFMMMYLCRGEMQENGTRIPACFRHSLYLDVFSWVKPKPPGPPPEASGDASQPELQDKSLMPAFGVQRYEKGLPVPTCPQELQPAGFVEDLGGIKGAPSEREYVSGIEKKSHENFHDPDTFLNWDPVTWQEETEKEPDGPAYLPYKVFRNLMFTLALCWLLAAAYFYSIALDDSERVYFIGHTFDTLRRITEHPHLSLIDVKSNASALVTQVSQTTIPTLGIVSLFAVRFWGDVALGSPPQIIDAKWPHANFLPDSLSCDSSGRLLVVSNKVLVYTAKLHEATPQPRQPRIPFSDHPMNPRRRLKKPMPSASFKELRCPALVGEALQDTAVTCGEHAGVGASKCTAFVLHRRGQRIAACALQQPQAAVNQSLRLRGVVANISGSWLTQHGRDKREMPTSISVDRHCTPTDDSGLFCSPLLGTSSLRVVQLQKSRQAHSTALVPSEVVLESGVVEKSTTSNIIRVFNSRYAGILDESRHSVILLDRSRGGIQVGRLILPSSQRIASFCAGGGHIYLLTGGSHPQLTRMKLPAALVPDVPAQ